MEEDLYEHFKCSLYILIKDIIKDMYTVVNSTFYVPGENSVASAPTIGRRPPTQQRQPRTLLDFCLRSLSAADSSSATDSGSRRGRRLASHGAAAVCFVSGSSLMAR